MKTFEELTHIANTLIKQLSLKIEIITPEMARVYLNTSVGNRVIKQDILRGLVSYLKNDTFKVNGETIVFDSEGSLMDGHHRLEAVAAAGVPAIFIVVRGVERSTWTTMDSGTARSLGDVFRIEGIPNYNSVSSVVAGTYAMRNNKIGTNTLGAGNKLKRDGLTRDDALGLYYKYEDTWQLAVRTGISLRNKLPGYFNVKEVGVISAYLIIFLHHDAKRVTEFWDLVATGDGIYASLRNVFLKDMQETRYKRLTSKARQSLIATAWNIHLKNKRAKRFSFDLTVTVSFT
nr:MAG TPA: pNOB8 ParB like protein [Caudoviricetes sp.]DAQ75685.1 MAG TPA: pNOB8 ParB like protein [Caudoviricetes sp.]